MKDIGYYAGFLSDGDRGEIEKSSTDSLLDLIAELSMNMRSGDSFPMIQLDAFWLSGKSDSRCNKLALIRGLCDQIELKLMEQAK